MSIKETLPSLVFWQLAAAAAGICTQVLLARMLGPHDKGILDLFLLIPTLLASLLDLGLPSANAFYAARGTVSFRTLHSNSLAWSLLVTATLMLCGLVTVMLRGATIFSLSRDWFLFSLFLLLPSLYMSLWSGLMYGSERARSVYALNGVVTLASLAVYGVAYSCSTSLSAILYLTLLMQLIKTGSAFWLIRREKPLALSTDWRVFKRSLCYGLALFVSIAANMLHFRLVQFLVQSYLGAEELAFFVISTRIAEAVWLLDYVIINAFIFRLTSSVREESIRLTQQMTRTISLLAGGSSLLLGITAPFLLPLLLGRSFEASILPLLLLLPGIVGWSLARSLAQFNSYQLGKPWYNTSIAVAMFVLNFVLNLLLIPSFGIEGAALASTASYLATFLIMVLLFRKLTQASFSKTIIPTFHDIQLAKDSLTGWLFNSAGRTRAQTGNSSEWAP